MRKTQLVICSHHQIRYWPSNEGKVHIACVREMRNSYKILVENCEVNRSLLRPMIRFNGNIKIDLNAVAIGDMECINLA